MKAEDDIYLIDMARILIRRWRWFAVTMAAVLVATFAFTFFSKPQWEATAWVQVGEFGPTPVGRDPKLEPFQRAIERMKTRAFQDGVLRDLGLPLKGRDAGLYRDSLKLAPDPYANLIRLSVRAGSAERARELASATGARLQAIHAELGAEPMAFAQARLQTAREELRAARAERDRWLRRTGDGAHSSSEGQLLAGMMLTEKEGVIRGLKAEIDDLLVRLTPRHTYETSLPWPVYVPERPVSPNRVLAWGVGLLLGAALGLAAAVAGNAYMGRPHAADARGAMTRS
jgi:hypothetical protein